MNRQSSAKESTIFLIVKITGTVKASQSLSLSIVLDAGSRHGRITTARTALDELCAAGNHLSVVSFETSTLI